MNIPPDLKRVIKVGLTLNPDRRAHELAAISAMPQAERFLGDQGLISLCVPSTQTCLYPMDYSVICRAVDMIHASRRRFIYGRRAWTTWPDEHGLGRHNADAVYHSSFYTALFTQVNIEAHALGAVGTTLDMEPSGGHPAVEGWKKTGFDRVQRDRVIAAIMSAREQLGFGVDYCHPAGSSWNSKHFGYATRFVADEPITHHTYKLFYSSDFNPHPPTGFSADRKWWCSWIHPDPQSMSGNKIPLTIQEFRDMDWEMVRKDWPDLKGVVLYAASEHLAWLLAELGKGE